MFSPGWVVWFPLRLLVGMKSKNRGNRQIHIKWSDELRQPVMLIVNLMPQDRLPPLQDHQDLILPISVWTWGTVDPQNSIFGESWWSTPFGCNAIALFTEPNPCKHFVYVSFFRDFGILNPPKADNHFPWLSRGPALQTWGRAWKSNTWEVTQWQTVSHMISTHFTLW